MYILKCICILLMSLCLFSRYWNFIDCLKVNLSIYLYIFPIYLVLFCSVSWGKIIQNKGHRHIIAAMESVFILLFFFHKANSGSRKWYFCNLNQTYCCWSLKICLKKLTITVRNTSFYPDCFKGVEPIRSLTKFRLKAKSS